MKNAYWVWRTRDPFDGNKAFHIVADWDVDGAARTKETYPIYNLREISFIKALTAACDAGFSIKNNHI